MIDWKFIEELEGKGVLKGYVPVGKDGFPIGQSGVTIGTGVDLGQLSRQELVRLLKDLPNSFSLLQKLLPYVGVKRAQALILLENKPLELTLDEAETLSVAVREKIKKDLIFYWETESGVKFADLPSQAQTVLFSLAYNFGSNLPDRLPNTWDAFKRSAETSDWRLAVSFMLQFPSKNKELVFRRSREALLLAELINGYAKV